MINAFTSLKFSSLVTLALLAGGCSSRAGASSSVAADITAVPVTEKSAPDAIKEIAPPKKEEEKKENEGPEKCGNCKKPNSRITFTWELPRGYVTTGSFRVGTAVFNTHGLGDFESCYPKLVNGENALHGAIYACSRMLHPELILEDVDFEIETCDWSTKPQTCKTLNVVKPETWPAGIVPKGSRFFGKITLSKGGDWFSHCDATLAKKPTDCFLKQWSGGDKHIRIDSIP